MQTSFPIIDADSHYYEAYDCFTRHLEAQFRDRAIHPVHPADGIGRVYQGERRLRFSPSWPIDLAGRPGALNDFYMGKTELESFTQGGIDPKQHPDMIERRARVERMDRQRIEATIMLPTLAVAVEHDVRDDVPALYANLRSFNRWVEEEWGYGSDGRVFGAAMISLVDPQEAAAETRRLIAAGVRLVYIRPAPVYGKSPADPVFDPVWAQLNEARIPVIFHIGDCDAVLCELFSSQWGDNPTPALHKMSSFQWYSCNGERAVTDTLAALIFGGLFKRFPKLRIMTIELGSEWVRPFMKNIDKAYRHAFDQKAGESALGELPSEVLKRHVWVTPFFEDDIVGVAKAIGTDRVLFGSDYPHPEGVREPLEFLPRLEGLSEQDVRRFMRDNTAELLGLPV
ncbi:MAG TPA: amidohydrolase family protein [Ramlibacter sp.]|nr:amidohydrolase family protein [Ramlibacter sp.]